MKLQRENIESRFPDSSFRDTVTLTLSLRNIVALAVGAMSKQRIYSRSGISKLIGTTRVTVFAERDEMHYPEHELQPTHATARQLRDLIDAAYAELAQINAQPAPFSERAGDEAPFTREKRVVYGPQRRSLPPRIRVRSTPHYHAGPIAEAIDPAPETDLAKRP